MPKLKRPSLGNVLDQAVEMRELERHSLSMEGLGPREPEGPGAWDGAG